MRTEFESQNLSGAHRGSHSLRALGRPAGNPPARKYARGFVLSDFPRPGFTQAPPRESRLERTT